MIDAHYVLFFIWISLLLYWTNKLWFENIHRYHLQHHLNSNTTFAITNWTGTYFYIERKKWSIINNIVHKLPGYVGKSLMDKRNKRSITYKRSISCGNGIYVETFSLIYCNGWLHIRDKACYIPAQFWDFPNIQVVCPVYCSFSNSNEILLL